MKYNVTIGIPVFRAESFIRKSIESALSQTYPSIEFLVIDDHGQDMSIDIVREIMMNNNRGKDIRILTHSDNRGVSVSRNHIIDEAQGDYIYFMDSDDTIKDNTIDLLYHNIRLYDAEIAFGSYEKIDLEGNKTFYRYPSIQLLGKDKMAAFAYRKYAGIQASACNYLVKTSILRENNIRFINANYWEDMVFTFDLVTYISKAVLLSEITYSYWCRENSLSHYQQREYISKEEVLGNVISVDYLKKTSFLLLNKVYFPDRCYNIILTDFYIVCNILKRKKNIHPPFSNKEIKSIMRHPATWCQIYHFKNKKMINLLLYVISKLPPSICVATLWSLSKLKKFI